MVVLERVAVICSQNIFIHWDRVSQTVMFPRIEGVDPFPESLMSEPRSRSANKVKEISNKDVKTELAHSGILQANLSNDESESIIEYAGFINMSRPAVNTMAVRELKSLIQKEKIVCKACSEKVDFVDAIREYLNLLSIKSLKNFIVVRGVQCPECKSKAELIHKALHAAHLPELNVTIPLFLLEKLWLFPRAFMKLIIFEPRYKLMLDHVVRKDGRFGLLPSQSRGIVVRIKHMQTEEDGRILITIVGEHRFKINGPLWDMENSHGLKVANVTLFVDDPVLASEAKHLREMEKISRREFFRHDTDENAATREATLLGHPPPENLGSEVFSHWLAMASNIERDKKEMFYTASTQRRLKIGHDSFVAGRRQSGKRAPSSDGSGTNRQGSSNSNRAASKKIGGAQTKQGSGHGEEEEKVAASKSDPSTKGEATAGADRPDSRKEEAMPAKAADSGGKCKTSTRGASSKADSEAAKGPGPDGSADGPARPAEGRGVGSRSPKKVARAAGSAKEAEAGGSG
jgi:Lon protease-like protein